MHFKGVESVSLKYDKNKIRFSVYSPSSHRVDKIMPRNNPLKKNVPVPKIRRPFLSFLDFLETRGKKESGPITNNKMKLICTAKTTQHNNCTNASPLNYIFRG